MTQLLSTIQTNSLANPKVMNDVRVQGASVRTVLDTFEIAVGDLDAADTINFVRLPADARIQSIRLAADDLDVNATETLAFDLGLHDVLGNVKAVDVFVNGSALLEDALPFTEVSFLNRAIEDLVTPLYELAGDTEETHDAQYDLVLTFGVGAATAQAGTMSYIVEYTVDV